MGPNLVAVDTSSWLTAAFGLVGAVIGAVAALLGQSLQATRKARAEASRENKLAVEEVLVRSQAVDLKAHEMMLLATNLGSLTGLISRVIGAVAPIDFLEVFERMNHEANALQRAAAQVWLFADERTVVLTNAVVLAAMDVVEAHHEPTVGAIRNYTQIALTGRHARNSDRVAATRKALAEARRSLVTHTRSRLDLPTSTRSHTPTLPSGDARQPESYRRL